jgi:hypothetical protein
MTDPLVADSPLFGLSFTPWKLAGVGCGKWKVELVGCIVKDFRGRGGGVGGGVGGRI